MIATFEEVKQMIETPAELDPRLKLYLSQYGDDTVLKHPLVNECPYDSDLNNLYNKRLASANKALGKAEKSEDWYSYIHIHEKPWRLEVFEKIKGKLSNEEYWVILSSILSNCFNLWQYKSKLPRLLRSRDCGRKGIMTNEEQDRYDALPEEITVHRGYRRHFNKSGWTWTISRSKAEFYGQEFTDAPMVVNGVVSKANIIAYYIAGKGDELVIDPSNVRSQKTRSVTVKA